MGSHHNKHDNPNVFGRLWFEAKPYWSQIGLIFFLELVGTPLALLMPIPIKIAVDSILGSDPLPWFLNSLFPPGILNSDHALLWLTVVLQIGIVFFVYLQYMFSYVLQTYCGEKMTLSFRESLFKHVQRLSFMFHDAKGTSDSIYRIQYDAPAIQNILVYGIIPLVSAGLKLLSMLFVITKIDPQLAVIAMAIVPFLFLTTRIFNQVMRREYKDYKQMESGVMGIVQEVLTGARVVKAFGREEREAARFVSSSNVKVRKRVWLSYAESIFDLVINVLTAIGTAAIIYIGVTNVQAGKLSLGELLMVISYLTMLYVPLRSMSKQIGNLQSSFASAQRAYELMDEVPDVLDSPHAKSLDRAQGTIDCKSVSFSYDGTHPVLNDISFHIPQGARVGIVGKTGAGKTTLISLLPRFYDPSKGTIELDGQDIRDYKLKDLRNQFSIVLQEPVLFATTIGENIAYAKHNATKDEVIRAASAANAHDFIMSLPDQYDTLVGERGMRLSGGERQRISLARAFLKDAPILLLDEPTSSVDTKTESLIMASMERLMKDRTTFMIAHRLSTIEKCDIRIEIQDGRIQLIMTQKQSV